MVEADWLHFLEARQTRYRQLDRNLRERRRPYGVGDDPIFELQRIMKVAASRTSPIRRERLKLDNRINPSAMPPRKLVPHTRGYDFREGPASRSPFQIIHATIPNQLPQSLDP